MIILDKCYFTYSSELDGLHAAGIHDFSFVRKGSHVVSSELIYPLQDHFFKFIRFYYILYVNIVFENAHWLKL